MKMHNLGIVDTGDTLLKLDIEPTDMVSKQELLDENESLKREMELEKEKEAERVNNLFISEINASEKRKLDAIEVTKTVNQITAEKLKKEKAINVKSIIKTILYILIFVLPVIVAVIAWNSGHRIVILEEMARQAEGIWNAAWVPIKEFFITHITN